jgi:hypothetical protein
MSRIVDEALEAFTAAIGVKLEPEFIRIAAAVMAETGKAEITPELVEEFVEAVSTGIRRAMGTEKRAELHVPFQEAPRSPWSH